MTQERSLLEEVLEFAEERQITLPVFSDVALKVQQAARDDNCDIAQIERALDSDQVLVTEILRAANSAFFGGLSQASSIRAAVLRLGLKRVGSLVLLATEKNRYVASQPDLAALMKDLWQHSSACAQAAEWIARRIRYPQLAETVFIGGLVHDIGKLFLLRVLDHMALERRQAQPVSTLLVREVLDNAHTEVGHRLLKSWNLPDVYQTIVRDHHVQPSDPANVPLQIVRLANYACNKAGVGLRPDPSIVLGATNEASVLGMNEIALAELEILLEDVLVAA